MASNPSTNAFVLSHAGLNQLIQTLREDAFEVVGPTVREDAIVYDTISSIKDLPQGVTDEQAPGRYRLKPRKDNALFGYVVGPHSWKKFLHPPNVKLAHIKKTTSGMEVVPQKQTPPKYAFLGVRACEVSAIQIQDKVFMGGQYIDPIYQSRREKSLIIAVNCVEAKGTCFCVSMNTGPKVKSGFDISLTEIVKGESSDFVAEAGSDRGEAILNKLKPEKASPQNLKNRDAGIQNAVKQMGRKMDTTQLKDILYRNLEHPQWDDVAKRCLTCANCTMVCPTCFCTTVEDVTDLSGDNAERWRKWDSCFTMDFSYVAGGTLRSSNQSRYRQWMTHKLASWEDQFGTSGCVGCGRCITWCPPGIDITQEVAAIRKSPVTRFPSAKPKRRDK